MTSAELREIVLRYLRDHPVMTLATSGPEGPWGAAVFYASDGFDLYFLSAPSSRHARDLAADPHVAATVQDQEADWRVICGIQLEGTATPLDGAARQRAMDLYLHKFPQISDLARLPIELAEAFGRIGWYRLVPSRLYFVDNTRGFGHRDEIPLGR